MKGELHVLLQCCTALQVAHMWPLQISQLIDSLFVQGLASNLRFACAAQADQPTYVCACACKVTTYPLPQRLCDSQRQAALYRPICIHDCIIQHEVDNSCGRTHACNYDLSG